MSWFQNVFRFDGMYGTACIFIALSVLFHFVVPIFGGFNQETIGLLIAGVIWFAVMLGLQREWCFVAYIAFTYCLIGSIAALAGFFGPSVVPSWLFALIVVVDVLAGVFLFGALWRNREVS